MKPTVPANFPTRPGRPGAPARPGKTQPRAVAVALPQAHPLAAAGHIPERISTAAQATLEAVKIFWKQHASSRRANSDPEK